MRGVVVSTLAIVLLGGCLDGCNGCKDDGPTAETSVEGGSATVNGPPAMSVGTLRGLGSHVWEATFELRGDRAGIWPSREVVSKIIWSELDFWEYEQRTSGALRRERQVDRELFRQSANDSRWRLTAVPAGNSLILRRSLQLWDQAMTGFGPQVAWRELGEEVLDGRPVRVLRVELAPLPAPDGALPVEPGHRGGSHGPPYDAPAADRNGLHRHPDGKPAARRGGRDLRRQGVCRRA